MVVVGESARSRVDCPGWKGIEGLQIVNQCALATAIAARNGNQGGPLPESLQIQGDGVSAQA